MIFMPRETLQEAWERIVVDRDRFEARAYVPESPRYLRANLGIDAAAEERLP